MTNAAQHSPHDWLSPEYVSDWVRKDPDRRPLFKTALEMSTLDRTAAIKALDLGGGYGMFASVVLDSFPNARVSVQDYSAPMLEEAQRYLSKADGRVDYVLSDLRDQAWVESAGGPFDLVVSGRAIHTAGGREFIPAIYNGVFEVMAHGGELIDCDYTYTAPLDDHLKWLHEAGFERISSRQEDANLVVLTARKP